MKHERWHDACERWHFSPAAIVAMVIGGLALAAVLAFLFGWLVMVLWNALMPDIFGLPSITYWQAWGLLVLSHLLIKGGWGHGGHKGKHGPRGFRRGCEGRGPSAGETDVKADLASRVADGSPDAKS